MPKSPSPSALTAVSRLVVVIWIIELVDQIFPGLHLEGFGIRPRELGSLPCILTAPWLHGGFSHLIANTIPLFILGLIVRAGGREDLMEATLASILIGGIGVWVFGSGGVHLGASILVFGYFGFVVARGWATRGLRDLGFAVLVLLVYAPAIFYGLIPAQGGVSWEGHLFGLIGGLLSGWHTARGRRSGASAAD